MLAVALDCGTHEPCLLHMWCSGLKPRAAFTTTHNMDLRANTAIEKMVIADISAIEHERVVRVHPTESATRAAAIVLSNSFMSNPTQNISRLSQAINDEVTSNMPTSAVIAVPTQCGDFTAQTFAVSSELNIKPNFVLQKA